MSSENILIFWTCVVLMAYAFIGYPLLIFVLSRLYKSRIEGKAFLPNVSVVLVVFNEAAKIKQRIENLLSSDYPNQSLEIVIVSDGSDDDTEAIVSALNNRQIKILKQEKRSGKPAGINAAIEHCSGEIVVFCDARQTFTSDTIRRLVSHFSDDKIGAVSGALEINKSSSSVGSGVDLYWKIEKILRYSESLIDSCIGCTGAVYAIRKQLFEPLRQDTILDDVVCPMNIALKGYRVIYDNSAIAFDPQPLEPESEKIRKQRTLAGNFQMLFRYPGWCLPFKNRLAWQLISHKYLRLAGPFLMAGIFISNIPLISHPFYKLTFVGQIIFYLLAILGIIFRKSRLKILSVPAGFLFLNLNVISGFIYYIKNRNPQTWKTANDNLNRV